MSKLVNIQEIPQVDDVVLIAGWRQWADAGSISSGLPEYLIDLTGARLIGELRSDGYYLFQIPATHHLLRPVVRFEDGHQKFLEVRRNEFYYIENEGKGVVIFIGDEPHMDVDRYTNAFYEAAEQLGVKRIASLGGVYGPVPYDKDREIGCIYSLPYMKEELTQFALRFSDYEGGASIGSYLIGQAESRDLPFLALYGFVPNYDFSQIDASGHEIRIENDYKAWYDIMRRLNRYFDLSLNLTDLEMKSEQLFSAIEEQIEALSEKSPNLNIRSILAQISEQFNEQPFEPLDDVWTQGLADLFDDMDE